MKHIKKQINHILTKNKIAILAVFFAVIVTALAIYLTPLKHVNLISPMMKEVSPKEFYVDLVANPDDYIFIDVRSPSVYQAAHAKGAINIPIENLYDEHYTLPYRGKKIALICTTGRLAAIAYGYLENWGFRNLLHIQGGMQNWVYEDLPIEGNNVQPSLNTPPVDSHQ